MGYAIDKVLKIAEEEVGYLEKKTNDNLYDKTANAGNNNFTKYWREVAPGMNGNAWCNCFVNWIFIKAYGETDAKKLLCTDGGWSFYTPTSSSYFKKKNQWYTSKPQVGDIIYYKNATRICHVGIVYKVDSTTVYTIEGNTSSAPGVVPNGGCVAKKSYKLTSTYIAGYGRPKYDDNVSTSNVQPSSTTYTKTQFIKDIQSATGAKVDGIAGTETLSKTVTVSKTKNNRHAVVKPIQKYLNSLGYNCGTVDGIAGNLFDNAVKLYQKNVVGMKTPDGEFTKGGNSWKYILGLK